MSFTQARRPDSEFDLLTAAPAGAAPPVVRRSWVNVPTGGHISGVHFGDGPAQVVFLHDITRSARSFDLVAIALQRPSVAIDLPGHGRSNWRRDGRYPARRLAAPVAEAISSFAPHAELLVGAGLGAEVAVAIAARQLAPAVRRLVLVDPLPGLTSATPPAEPDANPADPPAARRFGSPAEAADALRLRHPAWPADEIEREVANELESGPDGAWAWRHHPGNGGAEVTAAADSRGPWADVTGLPVRVYVLTGTTPGTGPDAPAVEFVAVPGGGDDPVALAPSALAAGLDGLQSA
jgi:pimeloyl-ACP methyl ester carboxylesterase